jgi:hypothetical protein
MMLGGDTVSKIKNKFTDTIIQKQFFMDCIDTFCNLEMHMGKPKGKRQY